MRVTVPWFAAGVFRATPVSPPVVGELLTEVGGVLTTLELPESLPEEVLVVLRTTVPAAAELPDVEDEVLFLLIVVTLREVVALEFLLEEEVLPVEVLLPEETVVVVLEDEELRTDEDGREVVEVDLTLEDGREELLEREEVTAEVVPAFDEPLETEELPVLREELFLEEETLPEFLEEDEELLDDEEELLEEEELRDELPVLLEEDEDDLDDEELPVLLEDDELLDEDELLDCEEVVVEREDDEVLRLCARASTWNVASESNIAAMAALLVLIIIVFLKV